MLGFIASALLATSSAAQFFALNTVQPPAAHALGTVSRFFVHSKHGTSPPPKANRHSPPSGYIPSYGWGIWDKKYALPAKIMVHDLAFILDDPTVISDKTSSMDLAIMEYDSFWNHFVPYQQENHFCCSKADVVKGQCEEEHGLLLPNELKSEIYVTKVPMAKMGGEPKQADFYIHKSGIYFLMFVNCADWRPQGKMTGAVLARGAHGYLSGMDVPKLQLYAIVSLMYAGLGLIWMAWCLRYKRQLIVLHHLIGLVITVGLLEQVIDASSALNAGAFQLLWYVHLSWANVMSPPSDILLIFSVTSSVFKNLATCLLILLASLGYCITRPSLESSTIAKIWAGGIALGILDATRQLATHFHVSLDLSVIILMVCALPITFLYTGGFIWAFYSLNALIEELKVRRQTAKFRQMTRYRCVLVFASIAFVTSAIVQSYVFSMDIRQVWAYEWIFTDAVPNGLFLLILMVTAFLWRPTRSSKYYSYNLQLPDHETSDSTLDIDRIRADIHGKAFEVTFDSPLTTGQTEHRRPPEIRAWGEIDLDMEDEEEAQPVAEKGAVKR